MLFLPSSLRIPKPVPHAAPFALPDKMAVFGQAAEVFFQGIATGSGQHAHFLDRYAAMFPRMFEDAYRQLRQSCQH